MRVYDVGGPKQPVAPPEFVAFWRDEYHRLTGLLTLYVGEPAVAEELAQEALVRAWSHWPRVHRLNAPNSWVFRVALNLATSHRRRRAVERRLLARHAEAQSPSPVDPTDGEAVRRAVVALPDSQRGALVLRFYADLSVKDTAAVLGITEGAVKARTSRALAALRTALGGELIAMPEEITHD